MAELSTLNTGEQIYNVSHKVGPHADCRNDSNDVGLVQELLNLFLKTLKENRGIPRVSGRLDAITGYYIYHLQASARQISRSMIVDGCVSHVKGKTAKYGGGGVYTIYYLDMLAKKHNRAGYEKLRRRFAMPPSGLR